MQRLAELLEDEQQPFDLEAYLLERGCSPSNTNANATVGCFSSNCKTKKKKKKKHLLLLLLTTTTSPTSFGLRSSNIRKTLCQKTFRSHHHHHVRDDGNMEEPERLSSSAAATSSTEFDETTMTPNDQLDSPAASILDATQTQTQTHQSNNKTATDRVTMTQWRAKEDNKQCSPDSVLDQIRATPPVHKHAVISSSQGGCPSTSSHSLFQKPTEDGILSASLWDLIVTKEERGISGSNHNHTSSSSTYIISSIRALQQTKQLLFDCVREAVESQERTRRNTGAGDFMGTENLGNFIREKIRVWNTRSATGENITRLQTSDLLALFHEWDNLEDRSDVIQQVGDQILEQIKDEIVEELIAFYTCNK